MSPACPAQLEAHAAHKARQARYEANAWREPVQTKPPELSPRQRLIRSFQRWQPFVRPPPPRSSYPPTIMDIVIETAKFYQVTSKHILSHRRMRYLIRPRHVAMYLAIEITAHSAGRIGIELGRDHSSILYGHAITIERLKSDPALAREIGLIKRALGYHGPLGTASGFSLVRKAADHK